LFFLPVSSYILNILPDKGNDYPVEGIGGAGVLPGSCFIMGILDNFVEKDGVWW